MANRQGIKDSKTLSYMTNGDKYTFNGSAKDCDAYLWNILDK